MTIEPKVSRFIDSWVHSSSPLDIDLDNATPIILPPLIWSESETIPLKMSVRNIGMTCNVDAEYSGPRPSLSGSILQYPYEFSSFHFHWGKSILPYTGFFGLLVLQYS
uniref:Alpha-carbonic anhydrase domain-containing protein n=1 Tax=Schizaphis graminum TaxID=13262 RepID=A0A2S2PP26_SCHGA